MATITSPAQIPNAVSSLAWWIEAGVETLVDEAPRNWLVELPNVAKIPLIGGSPNSQTVESKINVTSAPQKNEAPSSATLPPPERLPKTLDALITWFLSDDALPAFGSRSRRIAPAGDPAAQLMVLIDMPQTEDLAAGRLLAGEAGALFDKMLGALKFDRSNIWLAPMMPSRIAGGIPDADAMQVEAIARHHVALVRPQKLWLLGRAASRALLALDENEAQGRLHHLNHDGIKTDVIASVHPQVLLQTPKRKAQVWADMQRLIEV